MIIKLSEAEVSDCLQAANAITQFNKASGRKNGKIAANRSDREIQHFGCMTELAICKLFDVENRIHTLGADGGIDFWLNNISVDVKATFMKNSGLTFTCLDRFRAKVAILMEHHSENSVKVIGWTSKAFFEKNHIKRDFGYGERCFLEQDKLKPIQELWLIYKERQLSSGLS